MKKFVALLMAMMLTVSLAACGDSNEPAQGSSSGGTGNTALGGKLEKTVNLSVCAGGTSGSWYQNMAAMSELINRLDYGIVMKVLPGGGLSNPVTINSGEFQLGWTHSVLAKAAVAGSAPFDTACEDLRTLATSWDPNEITIAATQKSGYTSLDEIFENHLPARFCTGTQSTITGWMFTELLKYYGVTEEDIASWGGKVIYSGYGDWVTMAQDDQIDVMFDISGIPSSTIAEIINSTEVNFISPSDELSTYLKDEFGFIDTVIPAGTYSSLDHDVPTVATAIEISANKNVDDATVYAFLECLEAAAPDIVKIHSAIDEFDISKAWENPGCELHSGAVKFFTDRGYMQ